MQVKRSPRFLYPMCVLIAAALLLVCSKSSPLYPLNDWVDVNIYFTIGKGLMRGLVPYLDLYDQKGPMVYLLYGLGSLLSDKSFLGIYVLEALSFGAFLYYAYRMIALFTEKGALVVLPVLGTLILTAMSFSHGGSLEEFCLPVYTYALYSMLAYYQRDWPARGMPLRTVLVNGLLAGFLLLSKFTLLSFYFAWMAMLFLAQCLQKRTLHGLICCIVFVCGMLAPALPWLIYFCLHNALPEFFYYYFYTNIFGYSTLQPPILPNMLSAIIRGTLVTLYRNAQYGILICAGLLHLTFSKKKPLPVIVRLTLWALAVCLPIGLYMGGQSYRYYGLTLACFAPLGCIPLLQLCEQRAAGNAKSFCLHLRAWSTVLCTLVCVGASLLFSDNVYLLGVPKEETPQGSFAAKMQLARSDEHFTLLCRAFPDSGFYLAANVLPFNRFFSSNNVMLPENAAEQVQLINDGIPEFVITRNRLEAPSKTYTLLGSASLPYEGDMWTYRLYQRTGSIQP